MIINIIFFYNYKILISERYLMKIHNKASIFASLITLFFHSNHHILIDPSDEPVTK